LSPEEITTFGEISSIGKEIGEGTCGAKEVGTGRTREYRTRREEIRRRSTSTSSISEGEILESGRSKCEKLRVEGGYIGRSITEGGVVLDYKVTCNVGSTLGGRAGEDEVVGIDVSFSIYEELHRTTYRSGEDVGVCSCTSWVYVDGGIGSV